MSKTNLYQMFDLVATEVHGPIITGNRDEAVVRQFTDVLNRKETLPGQYPADFALLKIAEQNQTTGEVTPCDPTTIYTGKYWLTQKDRVNPDGRSPADRDGINHPERNDWHRDLPAGEQPSGLVDDKNAKTFVRPMGVRT